MKKLFAAFGAVVLVAVAAVFVMTPRTTCAGPFFDNNTCDTVATSGITFTNGATLANGSSGVLTTTAASENLIETFSTDAVTLTSSTGVSTFTFSSITPVAAAMTLNGSLTLANSETLSNAVNGQVKLAANGKDDLSIDLGQTTTHRIALSSTAGTNFDFGVIAPTFLKPMIAGGASYLVAFATDCFGVVTTASDNAVINLPNITAASAGCQVTVINTAANTGALIVINPDDTDTISGTCLSVNVTGAAGDAVNNTKATHVKGDSITLISDGVSAWYPVACTGVWAHGA